MASLAKSLLSWLWNVLQTYNYPQIAYSEIVSTLHAHPQIKPRTNIYTSDTGQQSLLVCLEGLIVHNVPLIIWIPQDFGRPGAGITCYVALKSSDGMVIRPGQHVALDGKLYHPYLRDWSSERRSSIIGFMAILQGVFEREPPLLQRPKKPESTMNRPPIPIRPVPLSASANNAMPPPLPVKPKSAIQGNDMSFVPPLPPKNDRTDYNRPDVSEPQPSTFAERHARAPPIPNPSDISRFDSKDYSSQTNTRVLQPRPGYPMPQSLVNSYDPQNSQPHAPALPQFVAGEHQAFPSNTAVFANNAAFHDSRYTTQSETATVAQPKGLNSPLDLLSDSINQTEELNLRPVHDAPPPIPANPEKEQLLQILRLEFSTQIEKRIAQSQSAIPPLLIQQQALTETIQRLQQEISQIQALNAIRENNENLLHQNIRDCATVIESSRTMQQPNIDDVLIAPTVVSQQLWDLCADEAAIRETLYCLQQGVSTGRISGNDFIKMTRTLSREMFLKMALARKVATSLGLVI